VGLHGEKKLYFLGFSVVPFQFGEKNFNFWFPVLFRFILGRKEFLWGGEKKNCIKR
jgi:hypothetical protein